MSRARGVALVVAGLLAAGAGRVVTQAGDPVTHSQSPWSTTTRLALVLPCLPLSITNLSGTLIGYDGTFR